MQREILKYIGEKWETATEIAKGMQKPRPLVGRALTQLRKYEMIS